MPGSGGVADAHGRGGASVADQPLPGAHAPPPEDRATSEFRAELDDLPPQERPARLRQLVFEQTALILRRAVDPDRPLPEYGLDSLGALELRTRLQAETGIRLAPKDISTTARGLADHLHEQLDNRRDTGGSSANRTTRRIDGH
ncbi:acyl carrier protein [Mycobacterium sp. Lab-001]|uniref:acyl carrier protein n=1 Tax=Mycobacterium sp. Lab-001 TaxID=3410136 RepID=UPI003D1797DE